MGLFWIRQTTESMWRISAQATVNARKSINANDDAFYGDVALAA
jgi:hypothetical protein